MESKNSRENKTASCSWFLSSPFRSCTALYRSKLITVEPAIFLLMLARNLYIQLYEQYYYVQYGSQLLQNTSFPFPNGSFCLNSSQVNSYAGNDSFKGVETLSNNLVVYGQIANRIPSIIVTILLGPLSDRYGRKPVLLLAVGGLTLEGFVAMLIVHFQWNPYYFIIANFIGGISGDYSGILSGGYAYIADVSSEKWRGLRIGIIEGVFAIGAAAGPLLVGYWLQQNNCDFILPLWLYIACNMTAGAYIMFCIPESLTKAERKDLTSRNPKGFKTMLHGLGILAGRIPQYSHTLWKLWTVNFVASLLVFNVAGSQLISVYFLKAPPFDVDTQMVGLFQSAQSASRAFSNTVLMAIFSAVKIPEAAIALFAVAVHSGCNLLIGFSKKIYQVYTVGAIQGVESLTWTALRTLLSKLVEPEDQGSMFGILAALEALFALLSTVAWPNIYNLIINHNLSPGVTYMIMAGVALVAVPFLIALLIFRKRQYLIMEQLDVKQTSDSNLSNSEKDSLLRTNGLQPPNYSTNTTINVKKS